MRRRTIEGFRRREAPRPRSGGDAYAAIQPGSAERRLHVRAYNYWVSLYDGRSCPSLLALDPDALTDFGPNSVLLDYSDGTDDPRLSWVGEVLREECGLTSDIRRLSEVPKRSPLSRLSDHYLHVIGRIAPIGFEADFRDQRGHIIAYRGILMPFASSGETVGFIYGVIDKSIGLSSGPGTAAARAEPSG